MAPLLICPTRLSEQDETRIKELLALHGEISLGRSNARIVIKALRASRAELTTLRAELQRLQAELDAVPYHYIPTKKENGGPPNRG